MFDQFSKQLVVFLGLVQKIGEGVEEEGEGPAEEGAEDKAKQTGSTGRLVGRIVGCKEHYGANNRNNDADPAENFC